MTRADEPDGPVGEPESALPSRLSALLREIAQAPPREIGKEQDPSLKPGAIVGRFEIVRELGRGGFGVVYEARDQELGRAVALKLVRPGSRPDLGEDQLLREAEAVARLSHPNVVTLFDVGRAEQGPYLVLELLRGETLAERIEQGPMALREALRVVLEVAKGLAYAHASGVVHRDLKPGNVFLCDDGQVKVLDLGMARAFGRRAPGGGTPGYMAPEQRRGAPEDERSDVFALGVILYRMLAGELPFPAKGESGSRPVAALDVPGAPALGELVSRMLDRDPVSRPRDAGEVLAPLAAFLGEIERTPSAANAAPARKRKRPRWRIAALVAAGALAGIVLVGLLADWMGMRIIRAVPPAPAPPSIAVLPFADLSPQKDQEYFSDGLAEEILSALASVEGLRVPSRTSSFWFKGKDAKLADIGRELNVRTLLEGSVRKAGNRVRVTAQLVNVADGYRLWSHTYDRDLTDVFAVQEEIARAAADALDVKLLGRTPRAKRPATDNPEAYTQYLLGRQQYYRATSDSFRLAVDAYERALALDSAYAPAWAGLGVPLYYLAEQAETPAAVKALRRRALAAAEKAVALSPELPEALSTRGALRAVIDHDWAGARADLERALSLNANDADSHRRYAVLLENLGRLPEAIAEARRAVDLDPFGPSWTKLGILYQSAGQLDRAEAALRRQLQIAPDALPALVGLGRNLLLQSRPKEALAVFERCPEGNYRLWGRAVVEHSLGHASASRAALEALVSKFSHTSEFGIAEVHAWRGERDAAFAWMERALADPGSMDGSFRTDPFLRGIRDDPRFAALLRRMNLPEEAGGAPPAE